MFFGCSGYSASIWHKYPGKWYHCSRTVTGCWSRYKQSRVGGVLLEESGKPVRFCWFFLHQQLFLFFIFCILLPCNKQTRSCRFFCTVTYNILFLGLMRNSPWCYNQLLFWSSSYTTWSWTHLTGTNTHTLLHISIKKNYIVKINLMYQIFKVLNSY